MKRAWLFWMIILSALLMGSGQRLAQSAELAELVSPDLILKPIVLEPIEPLPLQPIPLEPITPVQPTLTCETIVQESIKAKLPTAVGNPFEINRLLQVQVDDWRARINVPSLFNVIQDQFPTGTTLPTDAGIGKLIGEPQLVLRDVGLKESSLNYNLPRGEARYMNPRRMLPQEGGVAIEEQQGMEVVKQTISSLGLSEAEVNFDAIHSNVLQAGIVEGLQATPAQAKIMDIERTYFIPRQVNGIPVEDSFLAVGVTNDGQLSRFRVKWPLLKLVDTQAESVIPMDEIQQRVSTRLLSLAPECQKAPEALAMRLAYVPAEIVDGDESDQVDKASQAVMYKLQMVVHYIPSANEAEREESGSIMHFDLY